MERNMFKRCFAIIVIGILMCTLLCSCGKESTQNSSVADPFISIPDEEENGLVYHKKSNTVYVLFSTCGGYQGYGYCSLYVQNGHFCEYRDGKILEVDSSVSVETDTDNNQTPDEKWNSLTDEEKEELLKKK